MVEQSCASMYIETAGSILVDDGKDRVPCILPLPDDAALLAMGSFLLVFARISKKVVTIGKVRLVSRVVLEGTSEVVEIQGTQRLASESVPNLPTVTGVVRGMEFRGFENVITIGDYFMHRDSSLQTATTATRAVPNPPSPLTFVDISQLRNVQVIGDYFMSGCASLIHVDLTPFGNVNTIGSHFLFDCTSLTAIDLRHLRSLTSTGSHFMASCTSLKSADLSCQLSNFDSIADSFMTGCSSLEVVCMPQSSTSIATVGDGWLRDCVLLSSIDLSCFRNVTTIGHHFMAGCTALKDVDINNTWV